MIVKTTRYEAQCPNGCTPEPEGGDYIGAILVLAVLFVVGFVAGFIFSLRKWIQRLLWKQESKSWVRAVTSKGYEIASIESTSDHTVIKLREIHLDGKQVPKG